jgi:ABC-type glycerol-3-phosphate transport system permease component
MKPELQRGINKASLYVIVLLTTSIICFPLFWMVVSSIKPFDEVFSSPPRVFPQNITFNHYVELLETDFPKFFKNSFIVATGTTLFVIVLGTLGGYSMTRFRYRGRELISKSILLLYMFPAILLVIPIVIIMVKFHLTNSYVGLILTYSTFALPYSLWLLAAFFETIPIELEQSAMIDGATRLGAFLTVALPVAIPGIIATAIFTFLLCWNEYIFALVLNPGREWKTLPVGVGTFQEVTSIDWGIMMAAGVAITIPVLILFIIVQRRLVVGFGAGAVKG